MPREQRPAEQARCARAQPFAALDKKKKNTSTVHSNDPRILAARARNA
jgi:hypothetical protein